MGRKGTMPKPGDRRAGRMEGSSAPGQDLAMPVSTANAGLEASEERRLSGASPSSEPHFTAAQGTEPRGRPFQVRRRQEVQTPKLKVDTRRAY